MSWICKFGAINAQRSTKVVVLVLLKNYDSMIPRRHCDKQMNTKEDKARIRCTESAGYEETKAIFKKHFKYTRSPAYDLGYGLSILASGGSTCADNFLRALPRFCYLRFQQ